MRDGKYFWKRLGLSRPQKIVSGKFCFKKRQGHCRTRRGKDSEYVPCGVGGSAFLLPRSIDVNQGEVLDDLLHLLELKQRGEAALTCQRGKRINRKRTQRETQKV